MPVVEYAGRAVDVNEEGFLTDSSQWTPEVADAIAAELGLAPLGTEHWKVIAFCREDAAREGTPPGLRPRSLHVVALLVKPSRRRCPIDVTYIGREIGDRFVVGFGLDFDERYRNLSEIWEFEPDREA